jgi:hypothetical protein
VAAWGSCRALTAFARFGQVEQDLDPEFLQQGQDAAELHRRLAMFHVAKEDMARADQVGHVLLAELLLFSLAPDERPQFLGIPNPDGHGAASEKETRVSIIVSGAPDFKHL